MARLGRTRAAEPEGRHHRSRGHRGRCRRWRVAQGTGALSRFRARSFVAVGPHAPRLSSGPRRAKGPFCPPAVGEPNCHQAAETGDTFRQTTGQHSTSPVMFSFSSRTALRDADDHSGMLVGVTDDRARNPPAHLRYLDGRDVANRRRYCARFGIGRQSRVEPTFGLIPGSFVPTIVPFSSCQ